MSNHFIPAVFATWALLGAPAATAVAADSPRSRECFDADWHFTKGDPQGAEQPDFDHSDWRRLDLPHDWSVEGPFDAANPGGAPGGFLPCGIGWYRKTFRLPASAAGRKAFIEFDGIYMNGEVWINGQRLGQRPYGYIGVEYELTPHLDFSGENVLAVRVDNSLQPSARWYTGSGIYRHVWLTQSDPLRVAHWGTRVTTPEISHDQAKVAIEATIANGHPTEKTFTLRHTILTAGDGRRMVAAESTLTLAPGAETTATGTLALANPALWAPETPSLYVVRTELLADNRVCDRYDTPFGVREVRFDAAQGLFLNGKSTIMRGICMHQDLGPLGAALWDQALERRLRLLKDMGCNAIRTSHYPHSPELMELCNRMGFLVINETFDEWRRGWHFENGELVSSRENKGKARFGYHRYFDEWAERDLTDHLRRDRNHPSVILWSIGNEVPEAQKHGELETVRMLRDLCHHLDPTRPVTAGINFIRNANETGFLDQLDVVGYNGGGGSCFLYEQDHARFPERKFYASEVPHSLQTRGEYRTRTNYREKERQPPHLTETEVFPETDGWYESSYDNAAVRINARDSWRLTRNLPFVAGEFRWTAFDYIGESGGWPRVLGNFGVIDLCNIPKDTYYFYQSRWTAEPMAHLLPHWTWPGKDGTPIPVFCYTNCDDAELFVNGRSLGRRVFDAGHDMHLQWLVPYEPGELKVVGRKDGRPAASAVTRTAGAPARVSVSADQVTLDPVRRDLSYLTIRIEDAAGNLVPSAARWVTLGIAGPGRIVGLTGGDPLGHGSFQGRTVRTFNGMALAIVGATSGPDEDPKPTDNRKPGEIVMNASAMGLQGVSVKLTRTGSPGHPPPGPGAGSSSDPSHEPPVD